MVIIYDKDSLNVLIVYSGGVSQLSLAQSTFPQANLGECFFPDDQAVLSDPNAYVLVFTDGEKLLCGPCTETKTNAPAEELVPVTWRRKPGLRIELSSESITVGQEVVLTITVADGFDADLFPVVAVVFNDTPQIFAVGSEGTASTVLLPEEPMLLRVAPVTSFFAGNTALLEVLPP